MERRVVIIGGGLAGMIVAKELLQRGLPVVILEAGARLGGKAGADLVNGVYEEHGYHVFPGWYANIRRLLAELEITHHLIDITKFHVLRKDQDPRYCVFHQFSPLVTNALRNIMSGLLPWPELLLTFYFVLDLASEGFSRRWFLDRVSVNGLLRARFYAAEGMAAFQQHTVLQASSVPNYELSAMTSQKIAKAWMATRAPLFSILDGNLQETFIQPFEKRLRDLGADIQFGRRVVKLDLSEGKMNGVTFEDGSRLDGTGPNDLFVLATPPEVALQFVDPHVCAAEERVKGSDLPHLSEIVHLVSAPMAALHLYLNRRVPGIPREHVVLDGSRYGLSFIDVSQHWRGHEQTMLSVIASDFEPLSSLPNDEMARYLIEELLAYLPEITAGDIERHYLQANVQKPLFLNTIGAWSCRPGTRTCIPNLYTAGDYCQSEADLTTMESAAGSALATARDILQDAGRGPHPGPLPLKLFPRPLILLFKYLGLPFIAPFGLWFWLRRRIDEFKPAAEG